MPVKSMETVVEATTSMEMALGAFPRPGKVLEQRLLSPEFFLRRRRHCGTVLGKMPIVLGFSFGRLFIGGGAASDGHQGASPPLGAARRGARHPMVRVPSGPPPAPVRSSSFPRAK
jgi:hypothetical protein